MKPHRSDDRPTESSTRPGRCGRGAHFCSRFANTLVLLVLIWPGGRLCAGDMFPLSNDSLFQVLFGYRCASPEEADAKMKAILFNHVWNYHADREGLTDLNVVAVHVHVPDELSDLGVYQYALEDSVKAWLAAHDFEPLASRRDAAEQIETYMRSVRRNADRGLDSASQLWLELQHYRPSASFHLWIHSIPPDSNAVPPSEWKSSVTAELAQRVFLERDFLWGPTSSDASTWSHNIRVTSAEYDHRHKVMAAARELVDSLANARAGETVPADSR